MARPARFLQAHRDGNAALAIAHARRQGTRDTKVQQNRVAAPAPASNEDQAGGLHYIEGHWQRCLWRGQCAITPVDAFTATPIYISTKQVRLVQKVDTGKVYAMKSLQKAEMLKRDQVWIKPLHLVYSLTCRLVVGPCTCRARRSG